MSAYTVLHGRRSFQMSTNRLVIPAAEVRSFGDAVQCVQALTSLLEHERARVANTLAAAQEEGLSQGRRDAEQAALGKVAEVVGRMVRDAQAQRVAAREAVTTLALAVVSKLSASLGAMHVVPALIEQAVAELMPERAIRVRVAPPLLEITRRHLSNMALAAEVRADETLGDFDCVIESAQGQSVVSLDTQLSAIGKALGVRPVVDIDLGARPSLDIEIG